MGKEQQKTIVLLPGLDGTGSLFKPFIAALPIDVIAKVVVYPPTDVMSLEEHARFVSRELPPGPVILLAESFSGIVALALLALRLRQIEMVIFCGSFAEPPRPWLLSLVRRFPGLGLFMKTAPAFFLRQFCIGPRATTDQLVLLRQALASVSTMTLAHRLRLVATERCLWDGQFQVPCYYLQAKNDRLVPAKAVQWFKQHFRFFQLKQVEGPHFLLQAAPEECAEWVTRILTTTANEALNSNGDPPRFTPAG